MTPHFVLEVAKKMAEKLPSEHRCSVVNRLEEIQSYPGYAEPGYSGKPIVGNWNEVDRYDFVKRERIPVSNLPKRLCDIFEKMGYECEWSDEWSSCDDCGNLVRTQPDSHGWKPSYVIVNECELYCNDCAPEDSEEEDSEED